MLTKRQEYIILFLAIVWSSLFVIDDIFSLDYKISCDNTTYLRKVMDFTSCEGNNCTDYNFTQLIECQFGCDNVTHNCRKSEIEEYGNFFIYAVAIVIIVGVIIALFRRF